MFVEQLYFTAANDDPNGNNLLDRNLRCFCCSKFDANSCTLSFLAPNAVNIMARSSACAKYAVTMLDDDGLSIVSSIDLMAAHGSLNDSSDPYAYL